MPLTHLRKQARTLSNRAWVKTIADIHFDETVDAGSGVLVRFGTTDEAGRARGLGRFIAASRIHPDRTPPLRVDRSRSSGQVIGTDDSDERPVDSTLNASNSAIALLPFTLRLMEIVSWHPDWDGDGVRAIPTGVAKRATELALTVERRSGRVPVPVPAHGERIQLLWILEPDHYVAVYIGSDLSLEGALLRRGNQISPLPITTDTELSAFVLAESRSTVA